MTTVIGLEVEHRAGSVGDDRVVVEDREQRGYPADPSRHSSLDTRVNGTYRLVVLFLAYTGVRFGEMAALRVGRLDLRRSRAVIVKSVTPVQG